MMQIYNPTIELDGVAVRRIRESKRLTQLYVAKVVGVTTDTISRWENNRYPSIKRENLIGLAEALEVAPETLIHNEKDDSPVPPPVTEVTGHIKSPRKHFLWIFPVLLLIFFVVYRFLYDPVLSPSTAISARRTLPVYAAPGSVIPVKLDLVIDASTGGFIVREHFPVGWKLIESSPPASSLDNVEGMARWIIKNSDTPQVISYLIKVAENVATSGKGSFRGDVVLRRDKDKTPTVITGAIETNVEPYHWADVDGNSVIDDSEVLEAFDNAEVMKDVHLDWDGLSALWDEGQYRWDRKRGKFISIRSAQP